MYDDIDRTKWSKRIGIGTDGKEYEYTELYTDKMYHNPLVDYSYIVVETGEDGVAKANHDRWDYWSVSDFE